MLKHKSRRTLGAIMEYSGVGLHSGVAVNMTVDPAESSTGIVFQREKGQTVLAALRHVSNTNRHTCIHASGATACTVEHILSALRAHEITDAIVRLDQNECPILDGSARAYVDEMDRQSLLELEGTHSIFAPQESITFTDEASGGEYVVSPSSHLSARVRIEKQGTPLHGCTAELDSLADYDSHIASSRTFVLYSDLIMLAQNGLVKGGALETASVIFDQQVNQQDIDRLMSYMQLDQDLQWTAEMLAPRSKDEPARHKILDLLGDSALLGVDICARIECINPSHRSNVAFFRYLNNLINA